MKFSKEFTDWWESLLSKYKLKREDVFGDKKTVWDMKSDFIYIPVQWVYEAFKVHDEELKRLRKFEKEFRTLQNRITEYEGKSADCYVSNPGKSFKYEAKAEELKDELLYL